MNKYRTVIKTEKFPQLTRRVLTTENGLKSNNVTAMRFDNNGVLFVGTDKGLSRFDGEKFSPVNIGVKDAEIAMIYFDADNHMFVGVGNSMLEFDGKKKVSVKEFSSELVDVKVDLDGKTWILTKTVLYKLDDKGGYEIEIGVPGKGSCLAVYKNNKVYVGTNGGGLHALAGKRWHWSELMHGVTGSLSDTVTCLYMDPVGNIWVGTDKGVCVYDDNSYWLDHSKIAGLPEAHITDMVIAENGDKYFATTTGLIHQHNGRLSYYGYKRWLPSPHATGVAISPDGTVCVSTDNGISLFETKMMSLKEKAVELRSQTEKYNVNRGYVLDRQLDNEGVVSLDEGYVPATDNDGLWTGLYTAALCFEYACTKDPEVRAMAKRSLLAMIRLTRITGIEGFTARAIRYPDSRDYGTGVRHEWHFTKDEDGEECEWLGETSSDEMVGHFYCYANYYDLVADDEEKALIADVVNKILNHIIDNNFRLVDTDGLPTTWANWDPDLLNNDHKWIYEKGTNSLQMLTFLKIGYHITGDEKYEKLFVKFAGQKHFAMNLMQYKIP
ncbi:MAG: two-component regulator propeller domain-containing protein, partial [Oscillospiraceae bacterium]|nr:two-component regulator propeller domain-containing protein [Oscillospiraceae bacterium]